MVAMRARLHVTPRQFERVAAAAVAALVLVIVSGAAVRLTGSGLGCSDWPGCTKTSVVAPMHFHAWVEFGNRLVNAAVTIASLGALVAAWLRVPRRRDLTVLSACLVVGLVAEIVMGYLVVRYQLAPGLVTAHFLLGLLFLAVAVVLHHRSGLPDAPRVKEPLVGPSQRALSRLALAALAVVVCLGTVVTSTGPHGGSPSAPRFHFSLHDVARLHGSAAEVLLAISLVLLLSLVRTAAPPPVVRRAQIVLIALLAQGAVGYTQYLTNDPIGLVALHVAGASLLIVAFLRFHLRLWSQSGVAVSTEESLREEVLVT
jgi:cytochrome c oxidase assembly protein subunit 15